MGVLRIERDAPTGIAARVGGVAWRDFDLQLFGGECIRAEADRLQRQEGAAT